MESATGTKGAFSQLLLQIWGWSGFDPESILWFLGKGNSINFQVLVGFLVWFCLLGIAGPLLFPILLQFWGWSGFDPEVIPWFSGKGNSTKFLMLLPFGIGCHTFTTMAAFFLSRARRPHSGGSMCKYSRIIDRFYHHQLLLLPNFLTSLATDASSHAIDKHGVVLLEAKCLATTEASGHPDPTPSEKRSQSSRST